ncbi:MAG: PhzF family phenazine biosynthesis protein [Candidatus Thorarchaeota archaeon]|nr:MAG: PhzF family phenazine biosynthesis protein [Candidatus Thorarchaeota archaeon]
MTILPYIQTSVFVDKRYQFGGNQLATFSDVGLNSLLENSEMQGIAREMNFSETTFIVKSKKVQCGFGVRIFTPQVELPFAGHPTLGTAFVLKKKRMISIEDSSIDLDLRIGPTTVGFNLDSISMIQSYPVFSAEFDRPSRLADALGLDRDDLSNRFPAQVLSSGAPYLIVALESLDAIRRATPRSPQIGEILVEMEANGLVVFCTDTIHSESNLHARMFAPGLGVAEDPATGSAAGPLGAYAEEYGAIRNHDLGATTLIEQGYEMNRPSQLRSKVRHHGRPHVEVAGVVRMTAEGVFFLQHEEIDSISCDQILEGSDHSTLL